MDDVQQTTPSHPPSPPALTRPGILIVEDERIVAGDLRSRLHRLGYTVLDTVSTGEDAVRAAGQQHPDLVLMDIRLEGDMDGIDAAERIQQRFGIPVIYLSAYADRTTIERAKVTEPFGYLLKPFEDSELRTTLEMALYKRQTENQRHALKAQLVEAQKMESIGTLVVGLAHNLNNILAIILGYSSRLERTLDDPAKVSQSLNAINQAVRRGAALIQQLVGVTTKSNLEFASVNVNSVVQDLLRMVAEVFPKTIAYAQHLDPAHPSILADQNQFHQALLNVLLNARDAMPHGGTITVTTGRVSGATLRSRFPNPQDGTYVCISIQDTGEGMDESVTHHIFEPFFTTRDRAMFNGLGLSVVYGIVSSHHGFVTVDSTPGKGTTVTLYVPVETSINDFTAPDELTLAPGIKETILVVEDEEMLRALIREVLTRAGYDVLEAVDGNEGVTMFRTYHTRINLVLLDLGLPKVSGDDVFTMLRAIRPDVKVVFSTGYVKKEKTEELLKLGALGVVHKPFTVNDMLSTLRGALRGRPVGEQLDT